MNGAIPAIAISLWRQRLASPMRIVLLLALLLPPVVVALFTKTLAAAQVPAFFIAMILAAGAIGQEVSSGVLQLTFARPVTRPAYVIGRWLGAASGGAALSIAAVLVAWIGLALRGHPTAAPEALALASECLLGAATGAAILVGFSAFVNGLADVGLYVLLLMGSQVWETVARMRGEMGSARAAAELHRTLQPDIHFAWIAGHGAPAWTEPVVALSTLTLALGLAILAMNRKELSYAAD
jgi:ABC-type transport system involved in multi-copper enzyme maturation permease subunit